jgi:hypothetical protein
LEILISGKALIYFCFKDLGNKESSGASNGRYMVPFVMELLLLAKEKIR